MVSELQATSRVGLQSISTASQQHFMEVHSSMLVDINQKQWYAGRGSFGIVKIQEFRGIQVAVKTFLPRSLKCDVYHEASILQRLCHPYLPLLMGICVIQQPFCIVMQFHGFRGLEASTIADQLMNRNHFTSHSWLLLVTQLLEAIHYLHEEAKILHNDIQCNNILVAQSFYASENYQIVLIDFGKATLISESKGYHINSIEYMQKYTHISPEVIEGETRQTDFFMWRSIIPLY